MPLDLKAPYRVLVESEDPRKWHKLGGGVLVSVLGLVLTPLFSGPILLAWGNRLLFRVQSDDPQPLPPWEGIGRLWWEGIRSFVAIGISGLIVGVPASALWAWGMTWRTFHVLQWSGLLDGPPGMPSGFGALKAEDFLMLLAVPFYWLLDAGLKIALAQRGRLRDGLRFFRILRWGWRCKWECFLLGMVLLGLNTVVLPIVSTVLGGVVLLVGLTVTIPAAHLVRVCCRSVWLGQLARLHGISELQPSSTTTINEKWCSSSL